MTGCGMMAYVALSLILIIPLLPLILTPPMEVTDLLANLTRKGFVICLLSNNSERRVKGFSANLDCPHIWRAKKPALGGISLAMKYLNLDKKQVAIIGDQIFTDCFAGNRFGIRTILTMPIAKRDEWTVKLKRLPEKAVLRAYAKKGQNYAD